MFIICKVDFIFILLYIWKVLDFICVFRYIEWGKRNLMNKCY